MSGYRFTQMVIIATNFSDNGAASIGGAVAGVYHVSVFDSHFLRNEAGVQMWLVTHSQCSLPGQYAGALWTGPSQSHSCANDIVCAELFRDPSSRANISGSTFEGNLANQVSSPACCRSG